MTIIVDNYLREEKFQYKDETTNWELVNGGEWYFIEIDKLLNTELLQAGKLSSLQLNADEVELPDGKGICYSGKGVQFEFGGRKYDVAAASSQPLLLQALKTGNVKWSWSKPLFRKYGGTRQVAFEVFVVDKEGARIPDFQLSIAKNI